MSEFVLASELRQKYVAEQPAIKVVTNNVPRKLRMLSELSKKDRKDFDYIYDFDKAQENQCIEACFDERLVQYHGDWYDTNDTQRIIGSPNMGRMGWEWVVEEDHPFAKWDAIISDSFFSGVLFRFVGDDEVICGTYCS